VVGDAPAPNLVVEDRLQRLAVAADPRPELVKGEPGGALPVPAAAGREAAGCPEALGIELAAGSLSLGGSG
jgi:hypothetical protein